MSDATALPTEVVRLSDRRARHDLSFRVEPDAEARAAIAAFLGIPAIRKLRFDGKLGAVGRKDWQLDATLGATVVQDCVVTLAPVTTRIDEGVIRRYMSELPAPPPGEVEMPEDDTIEELPASLDLVSVMIEALSLALPPFPRADGADLGEIVVTAPGVAPLTGDAARPFANLASLRESLKKKDDPPPE
jgi:uncharacterized metal-binding protein YceD (DUF177 family)